MLNFVARVFRAWMNFLLWLILIGGAIGGAIVGNLFFGSPVLGFIIGGIVGFITVILFGGLIANFLNMVDNVENIKKHLSKNENTTSSNISPMNNWNCAKCGKSNREDTLFCTGCGEKK